MPSTKALQAIMHDDRVSAAQTIYNWGKQGWNWYQEKIRWTVSVPSTDRLYDAAHLWFTQLDTETQPRSLSARLKYSHQMGGFALSAWDDDVNDETQHVVLYYDEGGSRKIQVGSHTVTVRIARPDVVSANKEAMYTPDVLKFNATSYEGQQAVIALLRKLAQTNEKRKPALHLLSDYGDWRRRDDLPERQLDSVVLKAGQMERIRDDLIRFLDAEPTYVRRGVPWHRGYLLYGPPGTGKTSIVRALAAHMGMDLWYASLANLDKDTKLTNLVNSVGPRSILLLEDIDIFHAAREREDETHSASMAGLLNALDGVATPHGLITIMTTNDRDVLDGALIRAGRVDLQEEIGLPDADQVVRLFEVFWNEKLGYEPELTQGKSTADIMEMFKNCDDPEQARQKLSEL